MVTSPKRQAIAVHKFEKQLEADEEILWRGSPQPGTFYRLRDLPNILSFVVVWGAIFLLFISQPLICWVAIIPHVFLAFYFMVVVYKMRYSRIKNTVYAITDKRLMTYDPHPPPNIYDDGIIHFKHITETTLEKSIADTHNIVLTLQYGNTVSTYKMRNIHNAAEVIALLPNSKV